MCHATSLNYYQIMVLNWIPRHFRQKSRSNSYHLFKFETYQLIMHYAYKYNKNELINLLININHKIANRFEDQTKVFVLMIIIF